MSYLFSETSKLCRFFVKSIFSLKGLLIFFFARKIIFLWRIVEKRIMILLHCLLVVLATYGKLILCAPSITVSGIFTPEFFKVPTIFSKTL